jgi:dipeptidyl aminopeptidase/acylaminoacyl peptidase
MRLILSSLLVLLPSAALAQTRPSIDTIISGLEKVHAFAETAVSPDGSRVAWIEDLTPSGDGGTTAIWAKALPSGHPIRIAVDARPSHNHGLAWSPDGKVLAFVSDGADGPQIFEAWPATGAAIAGRAAPRQITHAKGQIDHLHWSADGKRIAFLDVAGSSQATGALVAYKPDAGVVGDALDEQQIAIAEVATGVVKLISPADMFVYDYDWSPDGAWFAAEAVKGSGTNNYWTAQLYRVDAATGKTTSMWKPPLQLAVPRISPDGKNIAVIHGIMSDEGQNGGDVYLVPAGGGAAHDLTEHDSSSARTLAWASPSRLLIQRYQDGQMQLIDMPLAGGTPQTRWSDASNATGLSTSRDGSVVAAVLQSFRAAPEVYAGAPGRWSAVTSTNSAVAPMWGEAKSIHWKSDAFTIQGWLLYPKPFDPAKKYPMVVSVHGGPSAATFSSWPTRWNSALPSQGYFVLLPNPRGSYGAGEAFAAANVKDFGYGDFRDIVSGIDAAAKVAPIDVNRVGIIGWSYGGYMTMWAVTQTDRFKAAVAGAGIVNWQSYYGQNRIDQWMLPFFGASVYDDPAVYARSSPITFIKKARTPTLVLHGDRDSEVPTPQGYEFWHALKSIGTPTELVIYEGEGHGFSKPADQRDVLRRLVAWFDKYLR